MSSKSDDWSALRPQATLVFSDLCSRLEASLRKRKHRRDERKLETYHNGHLHIHKYNIVPLLLDSLKRLETIANYRNNMVILFQDLDGQPLVHNIILRE